MADIFISYASEDRERVVPIVKALEEQGWSTFWDWKSIAVGKTWRQSIKDGLGEARCVLVLWSQKSIDSEWVNEEADQGKANRMLIPALIDDVRPPIGFGQIQAAKLYNWTGDINNPEFKKVVDAIESILGASPRHVREAERTAEEERKRKETEVEAERARKAHVERKTEPLKPAPTGPTTTEAAEDVANLAKHKPFEPIPGIKKPGEKSPATKIGVLIALAVVIVAGAILLFRQEPTKSRTEISAPPVKPEPQIAIKPTEASPHKKFTNSIGMEFVLIPAGSFTMGSSTGSENERPPHDVKISQSFYLQTTEVTQGQWKKVMGDNPSAFKKCGDDCPVENVSWEDAQRFIEKLNQLEKTDAYRLPSEAEWEYACRAGTSTEFSFGDDAGALRDYGWHFKNSNGTTQRVAGKKPNAWGLYDMHGNVLEWVEDDWHGSYEHAPSDGRAWVDNPRGYRRVMRGGGWSRIAQSSRSAVRNDVEPDFRDFIVGFRLSRSVALGS